MMLKEIEIKSVPWVCLNSGYCYLLDVVKKSVPELLALYLYYKDGKSKGEEQMVYGYCRISTGKQSIDRQIRNIKATYPEAIIVEEVYTGTKFQGRDKLEKIIKAVKEGDAIVFDSVSRMSRNAEEGMILYRELYERGISLIFLKEPHINTDTYKAALSNQLNMTGDDVDLILKGINEYLMRLAEKQIEIAFDQAQKEVDDLRQRTKEGIETARLNGKQIGRVTGKKYVTKKEIEAKKQIIKYSKDFEGTLKDIDVIRLIGIAKGSFYKYKRELIAERNV